MNTFAALVLGFIPLSIFMCFEPKRWLKATAWVLFAILIGIAVSQDIALEARLEARRAAQHTHSVCAAKKSIVYELRALGVNAE